MHRRVPPGDGRLAGWKNTWSLHCLMISCWKGTFLETPGKGELETRSELDPSQMSSGGENNAVSGLAE